jgi:hypothetical protein
MPRARTQKGTRDRHAETNPLELLKLFLDLHEQCPGGPTDMDSASQADGVHVAAHCTGCGARLAVVLDSETCRKHLLRRARAAGFAGSADDLWALGEDGIARVIDSPTADEAWLPDSPRSRGRSH